MKLQNDKIKQLESKISKLTSSVEELKVLNDIAVSSGKATDVNQVLNLIVQKSIKAIEAEQGSILLLTPNKNKPFTTIVRQDDSSTLEHEYHIGMEITGWVLSNKEPLIIERLSRDKRFQPSEEEITSIHSILCVPIWFEGEITGIMMLINKKNRDSFTNDDLTLFSIISVQAGQLIKNLELQKKSIQKTKESEKLEELDRIKTNFFTNISHEFKTPLTLILGPAKQIFELTNDESIKTKAGVIFKNARKLNSLTNQILELSRIEAGQLKLRTLPRDLISVITKIVASYKYLADLKKISLEFISHPEELVLFLDTDKIEKILSNLLSNAIKFTPEHGSVKIQVSQRIITVSRAENQEVAEILVSDTGIGIPEEQIDKIFERYYRIESESSHGYEGTGIGLALTKQLVEHHKGNISVESIVGKGTIFKIQFPMGKKHFTPEEVIEENAAGEISSGKTEFEKESPDYDLTLDSNPKKSGSGKNVVDKELINMAAKKEKPLLLIIEDNPDLTNYLSGILDDYYKINLAYNGITGLNRAYEKIPDLIISDIRMPKLDGIQLCRLLKSDHRTSHIPLILLTAKSSIADKLEGLETGADDYIGKPFEAEELKTRIRNLLEQRKRIQNHFKKSGFIIDEDSVTSIDKKFLHQTISTINSYLSDDKFNVRSLAEDMAVSRSLLHRKLVSLVGESPSDLIKRLRLNKAAKLIEQKTGNITEIAYEVGFTNLSYFSKCFQKQFGFSPSQYHTNLKNH